MAAPTEPLPIDRSLLAEFVQTQTRESLATPEPASPDILHHYTTAEGLRGIIEENALWATAAYYLNDASEIEYGCGILKKVLQELQRAAAFSGGELAHSFLGLLSGILEVTPLVRISSLYLSCFCENGDLLSQWRAYGRRGAYSIGFSSDGLKALRGPSFFSARLVRADYGEQSQTDRIHKLLGSAVTLLGSDKAAALRGMQEAQTTRALAPLTMYLWEALMEEIASFKAAAFREEQEWRLVVRPRFLAVDAGQGPWKPSFRVAEVGLVPYIKLTPEGEDARLPIRTVCYGPAANISLTQNAVSLLLSTRKYDLGAVKVNGSTIPLRQLAHHGSL